MPLILFFLFFALLFSLEGCWYLAGASNEENALRRYHAAEHPRRMTSDRYLDLY